MLLEVIVNKTRCYTTPLKLILTIAFLIITSQSLYAQADENKYDAEKENYVKQRSQMIAKDESFLFNLDVTLNKEESRLNDYLVSLRKEMTKEYRKTGNIPSEKYFFYSKNLIEKTRLFSILKKMPKGGVLHIHTNATGSANWLIKRIFTEPNTYIYWDKDNANHIKGDINVYKPGKAPKGFVLAKTLKAKIPDIDKQMYKLITLGPEDYQGQDIWKEFEKVFHRIGDFVAYKPVFMDYYAETFEEMVKDNIQYVELRTSLGKVLDLDKNVISGEDVVNLFQQIRSRVKKKYPEFNYKLIICSNRTQNREQIKQKIAFTKELRSKYPDFILGYDLIGEEDPNKTNYYYVDELLDAKNIDYYLHSGESNWQEDKNLFDAYLLNVKRIGHGLNLFFFPNLLNDIKEKNIPLEVCPISNQLLGYINDLRIHPARQYLLRGLPCVISSDDPLIFQTYGLTYDFWTVFMAWNLDLKALKKLSMNSLTYSGMGNEEKLEAFEIWKKHWDKFIKESVSELGL